MSKGKIEDAISKEVTKFYVKALGVGPRETRVYLVEDMIIVRLKGKLLPIEQKLLEGKGGIEMVKDIRKRLHEILTQNLGNIVTAITKRKVISSHSDISTKSGEILEVFILDENLENDLAN